MTDHERIWLQNDNDAHGCEGRLWCQDKVWPEDDEQGEPTEYVRADLIRQLRAENAMLQSRTHPNHVILIDGVGHYVNDSVKEAFGKLKAACAAVANASSYRMDIGAVETCRLLSKYIATTDGPTVRYNGTGEDYLRQALTNPTEDATVTEVSATDENALAARAVSLWRESCDVEYIPSVDVLEGNIAAAIRAALTPPTKVEFCGCMAGPNDPDPKCSECGGTGKSGRLAQPVAIKPLEWEYAERKTMTYTAFWADGDVAYYIDQSFGSDSYYFRTIRWPEQTIYDGDDLPSAKAAAQSDYEARIRSALVPQGADK